MGNFSVRMRTNLLRGTFTPDAFTPPSEVQIALTTKVPLANSSVDELAEPIADEYVRQTYPIGDAYWDETGFGELFNLEVVIFPTVLTTWGTIRGWAMVNQETNQCMVVGELINSFIAVTGMVPILDAGVITIGIYED